MKQHDPIVSIEDLYLSFNGIAVLEDINLDIYKDDFLGIIGPNGGGKTTLLKAMIGLVQPDRGKITVLGGSIEEKRHKIGYVPQYRTFDFSYPIHVIDVVMMGRLQYRRGILRNFSGNDEKAAFKALELMEVEDLANKRISDLSGGQQQRVILARAVAMEPEILLLDEPTSHVDVRFTSHFYDILKELHEHMAIVMVTHDITAVSTHVERIACLNKQIFIHSTPEITGQVLSEMYSCPVEIIAHGIPHRVLEVHDAKSKEMD